MIQNINATVYRHIDFCRAFGRKRQKAHYLLSLQNFYYVEDKLCGRSLCNNLRKLHRVIVL